VRQCRAVYTYGRSSRRNLILCPRSIGREASNCEHSSGRSPLWKCTENEDDREPARRTHVGSIVPITEPKMKVKMNPVIPRLFFTSAISTSHGSSSLGPGPGCGVDVGGASFAFSAVEVEVGEVWFVDLVKLVGSASLSCGGPGSTSPSARSAASSEASLLREREAEREAERE
jgi:hypothetical protein